MLPSPTDYGTWQEFASALITALGAGGDDVIAGSAVSIPTVTIPSAPDDGFLPVLWDPTGLKLVLSDSFWHLPTVPPIVSIDTVNLALASVETNQIADAAVNSIKVALAGIATGNLADGAVSTIKVADAAILSAKIGDAAIITAKIFDAAVVTAKIANAAIVTALIGDAQVVTAKIADLAVNTAKIANAAVGSLQIQDAAIGNAKIANLAVGTAQIIDLSVITAKIALLAVTTAVIADGAITTAKIGTAQITTALIQTAAIVSALIADANITTAKIADLAVTSAKISSLMFDKLTAGTCDAVIDMGTGLIRFSIGGNKLTLGKGFGTSSQFVMWFGPTMAESAMSETTAVFYLKTDGSAYFGGALLAGTLRNALRTNSLITTAAVTVGTFASNGHTITINVAYDYNHHYLCDHGTGGISPATSTVITVEGSTDGGSTWAGLGTLNPTETLRSVVVDGDPSAPDVVDYDRAGSSTFTWTPGVSTTLQVRAYISTYGNPGFGGSGRFSETETQYIDLITTETP